MGLGDKSARMNADGRPLFEQFLHHKFFFNLEVGRDISQNSVEGTGLDRGVIWDGDTMGRSLHGGTGADMASRLPNDFIVETSEKGLMPSFWATAKNF